MWRSPAISSLVGQLARAGDAWIRSPNCSYNTAVQAQISNINAIRSTSILENQYDRKAACEIADQKAGRVQKFQIGENVSRNDKIKFLVNTVIKWMLSKGQGNTMGTYGQLLQALDKDHRAEEAHMFWLKKVGTDLHSVPWQLCKRMISIYYRNNMLESLIKLFKSLEAFDRKPPEKSIIQKVADAYMMLGMLEEKKRALQKYNYLFQETEKGCLKKSRNTSSKKKSGHRKHTSNSEACMESLQ
ncbi:hypothetical protein MANES_12G158500v8 [Manihot esculenta]|uniref:Uncharacterized protein n=2 Tax=Manihot esculenta TaxID=3983 RepID=A0ACB7GU53_MANES|nr:hypothetical protein MANES_12G158500v8 [Manihot esculenta]KAG8643024.1 hypothetical protein MANES_12G158500v8 [Manihot esculenta]